MLGFPKKKAKKKVIPQPPKPSVTKKLTEEFGPLNEWSEVDTGPKRWSGSGMTEYEQGQLNEENFAAQDFSHKINKCFTNMVKAYNEFNKKSGIKHGSREDRELTNTIKMLDKYKKTFDKLIRKLI